MRLLTSHFSGLDLEIVDHISSIVMTQSEVKPHSSSWLTMQAIILFISVLLYDSLEYNDQHLLPNNCITS
jgi:hypothetical protein